MIKVLNLKIGLKVIMTTATCLGHRKHDKVDRPGLVRSKVWMEPYFYIACLAFDDINNNDDDGTTKTTPTTTLARQRQRRRQWRQQQRLDKNGSGIEKMRTVEHKNNSNQIGHSYVLLQISKLTLNSIPFNCTLTLRLLNDEVWSCKYKI